MDGWDDGPFQPFFSVFFCFVTLIQVHKCMPSRCCSVPVLHMVCSISWFCNWGCCSLSKVHSVYCHEEQMHTNKLRSYLGWLIKSIFFIFFYLYLLAQPGQKCFWRLRKVLLRQLFHSTSQDVRLKMEIGDIWVINVWLLGLNPNWSCVVFKLLPR